MSIKPFFRWFDLWIGAYLDRGARTLYVCPIPMFGLRIQWGLELSTAGYTRADGAVPSTIFCAEGDCDEPVAVAGSRCSRCLAWLPATEEER